MRSSTDSNVLEQEEEQSIFHAVQNCRKRGLKVAGRFRPIPYSSGLVGAISI
jgi:hypothetical protein